MRCRSIADWVKNGYDAGQHRLPVDRCALHDGRCGVHGQRRVGSPDDESTSRHRASCSTGAPSSCRSCSTIPAPIRTPHSFAIPNNVGKPATPEKHAAVLEVIKWMEEHSLFWATAGHIPANKAVIDSAEYKAMQPQATYAPLTANMVYRSAVEVCRRRLAAVRRCRQRSHRRRSTVTRMSRPR